MKSPQMNPYLRGTLAAAALTFSFGSSANAQLKVGDNPTTIHPSAALEVQSTNKGFLPPRVQLTGAEDATTIPSPAAGLIVFNPNAAGTGATAVEANTLYFWKGTRWAKVSDNSTTTEIISTARTAIGTVLNPPDTNSYSPTLNIRSGGLIDNMGNFTAPEDGFYNFSFSWEYYAPTATYITGDMGTLAADSAGTSFGITSGELLVRGASGTWRWNNFDGSGVRYLTAGTVIGPLYLYRGHGDAFHSAARFRNINLVVMKLGESPEIVD